MVVNGSYTMLYTGPACTALPVGICPAGPSAFVVRWTVVRSSWLRGGDLVGTLSEPQR